MHNGALRFAPADTWMIGDSANDLTALRWRAKCFRHLFLEPGRLVPPLCQR